jgi:hypothetical protein
MLKARRRAQRRSPNPSSPTRATRKVEEIPT